MVKADLHVHSKYSDYPSTWVLKAYNSPESFTDPEIVYQQAKSRGMDFVTLTDHDDIRGSLELVANHPQDTFVSCEVTAWFPEDGCKVHILVYGINQAQYKRMMVLRRNLYHLRDYILAQGIAYSVAHLTYDQDGKLSFTHIEKLVLLFDVFEVINGGASSQNNVLAHQYLLSLDEQKVDELQARYGIQPAGTEPWRKGFTGGSDDHCGLLIGSAFTQSKCASVEEFLQNLRDKRTLANGLHGSFEAYATGVIKHIHDYRLNRDKKYQKTKMHDFLDMFFVGNEGNWIKRFKKSHSLRYLKRKNNRTYKALHELLSSVNATRNQDMALKVPLAYEQIAGLHDEMFRSVVKALTKNLPAGNIFKTFQQLATLFPLLVMAAPFVGAMRHQVLKSDIKAKLIENPNDHYSQKALWFTDTIDDLNGVSVSLRQIALHSQKLNYQVNLVTCVDTDKLHAPLPEGTLNLQPVCVEQIPGYQHQAIGFPSLLGMMRQISREQPDQIIISTPGPVGIGALLCARLMDIPTKAIYHTDFAEQVLLMSDEPMLAGMVDQCVNAFYKLADETFVPSNSYINKLADAGLERSRMKIFPRGLDTDRYRPAAHSAGDRRNNLSAHKLQGEFTLMFAGRISQDKNLGLLVQLMEMANRKHPGRYNLVIAGDGPFLDDLKSQLACEANVLFTGRIDANELVSWYQQADLFVFPSHTDTFGMVVLEAQACGTPCLVTSSGGPKEIIDDQNTGRVVHTDDCDHWYTTVQEYFKLHAARPDQYRALEARCAERVKANNSWRSFFDSVVGEACRLPAVSKLQQPQDDGSSTPDQKIAA